MRATTSIWWGVADVRNLLSAGFVRLWRNKVFWLSCALLAGTTAAAVWTRYSERVRYGYSSNLDTALMYYVVFIAILIPLVCGLLIGVDYNDGTIRNKLICGHGRGAVYLSNLILCSAASLIMCTAAVAPGLALGLPLLGGFDMGPAKAALFFAAVYALALAWTALFTLFYMLANRRIAAMLLALLLLLAGSYINSRLEEPPTEADFVIVNDQVMMTNERDNPRYLPEGPVRQACQFLFDFLPGGQTVQYANPDTAVRQPLLLMTYDAVLFVLSTAAGLALFKRKDLK